MNAARNARRSSRAPEDFSTLEPEKAGPPGADERVRAAIAALPERQRLALFLRYYADLDYAAIAETVGVWRGTVSATLNQAHATLRRQLEEADK